ncbi:MAG: lysoplasmalogenase [Lutimonas sp.]
MKNNRPAKVFLSLFFLVSFLDILGVILNNALMQAIFKPMIILSLMAAYFFGTEKPNNWYLLALSFSFLGDVFLLDKNDMFLQGIGAFLVTQILYVYILSKELTKTTLKQKLIAILPFVIYYFVLITILKQNLGSLLIPVMIYGSVISLFGITAFLTYLQRRDRLSLVLFIGALLFILSDSLIALQNFHQPNEFFPSIIMITYVLAQYYIYLYMRDKAEELVFI